MYLLIVCGIISHSYGQKSDSKCTLETRKYICYCCGPFAQCVEKAQTHINTRKPLPVDELGVPDDLFHSPEFRYL